MAKLSFYTHLSLILIKVLITYNARKAQTTQSVIKNKLNNVLDLKKIQQLLF